MKTIDENEPIGARSPAALRAGNQVLKVVVEHTDFKRVFKSCIDLIDTLRTLKMPSGILIQAEPGMGKSLLLQMIKTHLTRSAGMSRSESVLEVRLDSAVDTHKLSAATMLALGYPALPTRPNLDNMNHMVDRGMERVRPLAILLDEMQHTCEGNRDITARAVTDWLKVRMDRFNMPVIGAGTRALERLNTINPQFISRASATFVLSPFDFGDPWRQLLGGFVQQVNAVNLDVINGALAKPLHTASKGNLRALKKLLMYACMYAADRKDAVVMREDFIKAFEDANGSSPDRVNPFVQPIGNGKKS